MKVELGITSFADNNDIITDVQHKKNAKVEKEMKRQML